MPTYALLVFLLPKGVCKDIELMLNSFLWGNQGGRHKGLKWMRWEHLCKPKPMGGLGFKKLHDFNLSMLCKQGWKLLTEPSSLVARIFQARYYPHASFQRASLGNNPNYVWRSIWTTKDLVCRYSRVRVGDGSRILVTQDPWLPDTTSSCISTHLGAAYEL